MESDPSISKCSQEQAFRFNRPVPPAPPILRPSLIFSSPTQSEIRLNDVWPLIHDRLVTYLNERGNAESNLRSAAETRLHTILKTTGGMGAATQNIELTLLFKLLRMLDIDTKELKSSNQTVR